MHVGSGTGAEGVNQLWTNTPLVFRFRSSRGKFCQDVAMSAKIQRLLSATAVRSEWAQKEAFRLHHTILGMILGLGEVCWVSKRIRWHANCIEPSHDPANMAAPVEHEDPMERNSKHLEAYNNRVDPSGRVNELRIPPKYCQ